MGTHTWTLINSGYVVRPRNFPSPELSVTFLFEGSVPYILPLFFKKTLLIAFEITSVILLPELLRIQAFSDVCPLARLIIGFGENNYEAVHSS